MQNFYILKILKSYGKEGRVLAKLLIDNEKILQRGKKLFFYYKGEERFFFLKGFERRGGKSYIITLSSIDSKEKADSLKGTYLYIKKREKRDEENITGYRVYDVKKGYLGKIDFVEKTFFLKRLYIKTEEGKEIILPWVEEYVKGIDKKKKLIKVNAENLI
ncbi:MAG: hypothetical protein ABIM85_02530 [candidate division WOR-3 bacterium]